MPDAVQRTLYEQIREAIAWSRTVDPDDVAEVANRFGALLPEAADTIESLQAAVERLRAVVDACEADASYIANETDAGHLHDAAWNIVTRCQEA